MQVCVDGISNLYLTCWVEHMAVLHLCTDLHWNRIPLQQPSLALQSTLSLLAASPGRVSLVRHCGCSPDFLPALQEV